MMAETADVEKFPLLDTVNGKFATSTAVQLVPDAPEVPKHTQRYELQGLRAVAIISVLLFHVWGAEFKSGYLGVDVFFVISGYLMCHLLCRKVPLNSEAIWDFYFRRIKRIVPIYLFVCGFTLMVAKQYVSRLDYQQLIDEAVPSIFFYSNSPSVHKTEYFDLVGFWAFLVIFQRSKYFFFLHSWSLSVEIQFYMLVPLLFLLAQRLRRPVLIFGFGFLLFVGSFFRQFLADGVSKHMPLDGRIWQFMSGFAAHFIYESGRLSANPQNFKLLNEYSQKRPLLSLLFSFLTDFLIIFCLLCSLLLNYSHSQELERLIVVLVAAVFVSLSENLHSLLSAEFLVTLGDVSYSVYLIHWPILTLHRFVAAEIYENSEEGNQIVGTYLITVSILIGYTVERIWGAILQQIKTWRSLIPTVALLYALIFFVLFDIHKNSISLDSFVGHEANGSVDMIAEHTEMFWESRQKPKPLNVEEALRFNGEIVDYGSSNHACRNESKIMPTPVHLPTWRFYCNERGSGHKNVVILGNSHAFFSYFGVKYHFLDVADKISMLARAGCTPAPEVNQYHKWGKHGQHQCIKWITASIEALRNWDYPIDVIIALFGHDVEYDPKPVENWNTDPMFQFMEDYFRNLSEIARDVVFVPKMNLRFRRQQVKVLQERLLANQNVTDIGETMDDQMKWLPNIRKRIDRIKCDKCVIMDWYKLWCKDGNFCRTVEEERSLAYFLDEHHVTPYGSMFVGEYIRNAYEDFLKKRNKISK